MSPTYEATRDRVLLGKCTIYSAQTGNFCEAEGEHTKHIFTTPNGVTYKSKFSR